MKKILVTGGAGYIGSHTCLELLNSGYEVVVVDDLSNSVTESLSRVEKLANGKKISFYQVDLLNKEALHDVFVKEANVHAVIHFAAKKAVGESVEKPLYYYSNNITGSLNLFEVMKANNVDKIVFSSSATVYGDPETVPIKEDARIGATNPYGHTKAMMEQILMDTGKATDWGVALLRYFNPVGAHESGTIGEDPEYPNNLLPFVSQVAAGIREQVAIFGDDYDTPDGTGVRDYIHVVDLAQAHVKSIEKLDSQDKGTLIYNIGTGRGYSVKEMIEAFRRISGKEIKAVVAPRREGDIGECTADASLANNDLGWHAKYDLDDMIASAWKWQSQNPNGYK
ncbi:UDP-glucose 4-epimerase GalE [Lentisphaera marina]|uniref:UDP-glucose 4-epimerase GalE n=1 Tax=Lentisphaera marina TaxID=1111041 RepID=UPI0023671538|nr:UDP-glucose 4-epimerase GalE [Lentisphaera marina]MDD7984116.1 UDP-glucose 4-epimerase GalE [Lentisphaera marina]